MPTYEFRCPKGHDFEKFYRTISGAEAQAACPVCGELAERIMSPTSFAFKGSGFYLTDYGKNAHRDKGSAPKSPASDSGTSDSGGNSSSSDVKSESSTSESSKGESAKSGSGTSAASTGGSPSPAPPAESKPAAPKKSSGE
jgi:putative FmdB family regulatory protein